MDCVACACQTTSNDRFRLSMAQLDKVLRKYILTAIGCTNFGAALKRQSFERKYRSEASGSVTFGKGHGRATKTSPCRHHLCRVLSGAGATYADLALSNSRTRFPMASPNRGGTALPICVYFGTSRDQVPSLGFPARRSPPVVRAPQKT